MKLHHALLASATLLASLTAQAQTVSVNPGVTGVAVGDSFSVDIQASGFLDKIFGGGYNVAFDPSVLKLDGIDIPAAWEFATSTGLLDPTAGTVGDIYFNTFSAPIKGDFLTTTLKFTAIGAGASAITLSESVSFPFGDEFGNAVNVKYVGGSVIASVPEPVSLAMILGGLACMGWVARRRQA